MYEAKTHPSRLLERVEAGEEIVIARNGRPAIEDPANDVHVSGVSAGEVEIKRAIGKLRAPDDLLERVQDSGFTEPAFTIRHGLAMRELLRHHEDPFDRMLVAQARVDGLTVVAADRAMSSYEATS
ncbi:hypothetical protein BJF78_06090 [Pseudonocardia sp. CNS-139]|nr:hypothetical protein BJF78_06090 [Pseudonocardia sp. CNS-139]